MLAVWECFPEDQRLQVLVPWMQQLVCRMCAQPLTDSDALMSAQGAAELLVQAPWRRWC